MLTGLGLRQRLAAFYFVYFAAFGAMLPYWSLYLRSLGLNASEIGWLLAIPLATRLLAPSAWGWLADHWGRPMAVVRIGSLGALTTFAVIYALPGPFAALALAIAFFSLFSSATLPQFEAATLAHLADQSSRYGKIRWWGSLGFILATSAGGVLVQTLGAVHLPALLLTLFAGVWLNSLLVPEPPRRETARDGGSLLDILSQRSVIALLIIAVLIQASHGPYYAFFSVQLTDLHYSATTIGALWNTGVGAEIGIFFIVPKLLRRHSAQILMMFTLALTTLRWLMIGWFADNGYWLLTAQTLHGFSFGMHHAVSMTLLHSYFSGPHQSRGQALYSSLSTGVGGALASVAAGYSWSHWGPTGSYAWAAGLSGIGLIVAWRGLRVSPPASAALRPPDSSC
ncbi:MAG: MFS transporter [Gammaproteobacteria bacterium]